MNRREFIRIGAGGAAMAIAGCATERRVPGGDGNIRAESPEQLLAACKAVHDAGYSYMFIEDKIDWS